VDETTTGQPDFILFANAANQIESMPAEPSKGK
jgi:hypothetical protein